MKLWLSSASSIDNYSLDEVGHNVQTITPAGPSTARGVTTNAFDANGNLVAIGVFGFQRGVIVASRSQLGLPA